jgi:hypothetical protein
MTRAIWVEKAWCPKIRSLVETFNKYAGKKALSLCAESLEKLVYYLDNDNGQVGIDAADALASIIQLNPHLITNFTGQKIDEKLSLYGNKTQFEQHGMPNSQTNMFGSSDPYSSADSYASTDSYTSADPYASNNPNSADGNNTYENESGPSYQDYYQSDASSCNENESGNTAGSETKEDKDDHAVEDLLSLAVEQLKIKNVTRVYMDEEEKKKRKCAMGDGEFEGYDGDLYQCTCGTLYHDSCLKIQAIYVGTCQICDREFLKKED